MKKTWWKVPLYCMLASWICFQLEIRFLGQLAIITLPDGSISMDNTRWMILSGVLLLAVVLIGGLVFFRRMTRREIFFSASVMVALNIVLGLISYKQSMVGFYWSELTEWNSIISEVLYRLNLHAWLIEVICWLPPYIFVPFGRREQEENGLK
jgi:hypothetical protein